MIKVHVIEIIWQLKKIKNNKQHNLKKRTKKAL